jgi:hypothetical protein
VVNLILAKSCPGKGARESWDLQKKPRDNETMGPSRSLGPVPSRDLPGTTRDRTVLLPSALRLLFTINELFLNTIMKSPEVITSANFSIFFVHGISYRPTDLSLLKEFSKKISFEDFHNF